MVQARKVKSKREEQFAKIRFNTILIFSALKNAPFFIVAAFFNEMFPIILCIILSYVPQTGLQCILGVGRTAYFTVAFCQLGITFTLSVNFLYEKYFIPYKVLDEKKRYSYSLSNSIAYTFIIACFLVIVYIVASYIYMYYSTYLPNTFIAFHQGMNYVYCSAPYIFLLCLFDILLLYIYTKKRNVSVFFLTFFYGLTYILIYLLCLVAHLGGIGAGISLLISCIVTLGLMCGFIFIYIPIQFTFKLDSFFYRIRHIKGLIQEGVTGICINVFRGVALLIISFTVFNQVSNDIVPMAYNLAIIFLLNYMYIIAFLGIGFADMLKYYYYYYPVDNKSSQTTTFWVLTIINILVACLFTYICSVVTVPLATLYAQNDAYIVPLQIPQFPQGMPTIVSGKLPPTQFPNLPSNFYTDQGNTKAILLQYFNELMQNPNAHPEFFSWFNWFKNNPVSLNVWILNNPDKFFTWLQSYEYYASCNPHVVNAFINMRTTSQINEPNQFELLLSKQLKFNAHSMIYFGVFGITYSAYYIFSASNSAISKEVMPIWLIVFGSFAIITFVVVFGACFTMLLSNWEQNPFMNLDAFSFPLMLAGLLLFFIAFGEFSVSSIKNRIKLKKKMKQDQVKVIKVVNDGLVF